jgi:hypothetical protein
VIDTPLTTCLVGPEVASLGLLPFVIPIGMASSSDSMTPIDPGIIFALNYLVDRLRNVGA